MFLASETYSSSYVIMFSKVAFIGFAINHHYQQNLLQKRTLQKMENMLSTLNGSQWNELIHGFGPF